MALVIDMVSGQVLQAPDLSQASPQESNTLQAPTPEFEQLQVVSLPSRHQDTRLMARDPSPAYAHWDLEALARDMETDPDA